MEFKSKYYTNFLKKVSAKRLYKFDVFYSWLWNSSKNNKNYENSDEN